MGAVKGELGIKDSVTPVLQTICKEQKRFRDDVKKTQSQMKQVYDKTHKVNVDTTAATKAASSLKSKFDTIKKGVTAAVKLKDSATAKIKPLGNKLKQIGSYVGKPVIHVAVKGAEALSKVGAGIAKVGKAAAIGLGAAAAAGGAALTALYSGSEDAAKDQIEAETKLGAVLNNVKSIQARGAGAAADAKKNLMGVASSLQQVGVIGDEVTLAGMQQLATFQLSDKEIQTLSGGMTDLLAQQKGLNATQEDAVGIGNMIGKVMQGQTSALSRVGITFDEVQEKALKTGTAEQRAAVLAEILQQNVGGVNKALAETDQGKIQQVKNAFGDMREEVGKVTLSLKAKLSTVVMKNLPVLQKLGTTIMTSISRAADYIMPVLDRVIGWAGPALENMLTKIGTGTKNIGSLFSTMFGNIDTEKLQETMVQFSSFKTTVSSSLQQLAGAVGPVLQTVVSSVQDMLPSIIPVLSTVVSSISGVLSAAAPIISGLVSGISYAVTTLAPVFQTIFQSIGEKVGSVVSFVGERMGFITSVINWAVPMVRDILSTAWTVIGPVMDIAISTFKILFAVVQKVFPGIKAVITTVWNAIKPIIEGIGSALNTVAKGWNWIANKISGGGADINIGSNANGTQSWRGGLTWVGEQGPELINLPRGTQILSNRDSTKYVQQQATVAQPVTKLAQPAALPIKSATSEVQSGIVGFLSVLKQGLMQRTKAQPVVQRIKNVVNVDKPEQSDKPEPQGSTPPPPLPFPFPFPPSPSPQPNAAGATGMVERMKGAINVTIAKLADQIIVREDADIDRIGEAVARKIVEVAGNMA